MAQIPEQRNSLFCLNFTSNDSSEWNWKTSGKKTNSIKTDIKRDKNTGANEGERERRKRKRKKENERKLQMDIDMCEQNRI